MARYFHILFYVSLLQSNLTLGQDSTRVLSPVPVFATNDSILRFSNISTSVPNYLLTKEYLQTTGFVDVGEALKIIPGGQIKDYGGIGGIKTMSYRGLGAGHTTVQMDGVQIPNLQSGVVNLSSFELFGIDQVEFTTGQSENALPNASTYIQANAISIQSLLYSAPKKRRLGLYSSANSIHIYEHGAFYQERLGKKLFIGGQGFVRYGEGTYQFHHPELNTDTLITRENSQLVDYRLRGVVGYQSEKLKVVIDGYYRNNDQELPGAAVLFNPSNDQTLFNEDWRLNGAVFYSQNKWNAKAQYSSQSNTTRYFDPYVLNLQGYIDANYVLNQMITGFMVERKFRFPQEKLFIGSDIIAANLNGNQMAADPHRTQIINVIGGGTMFGKFRLDANLSHQYIEDQFLLGDHLDRRYFNRFSPFFSVAFRPFKKHSLRLRTFYKQTFRMPTFNDLYYNFIGNTELKPEDAELFNTGITYGLKKNKIEIESTIDVYYNQVKNKIVAIPTKDVFNWSMQNIGKSIIMGVDLGLFLYADWDKIKMNLSSTHNFNRSEDRTNEQGVTYGHQLPYTPYYSSTHSIAFTFKSYTFSSTVLYSGYRFSLNENNYANYLDPFTDVSFGLTKAFKLKKQPLNLSIRAMNMLNKNYQVIRSFPMPGRYLQLKLNYKFSK